VSALPPQAAQERTFTDFAFVPASDIAGQRNESEFCREETQEKKDDMRRRGAASPDPGRGPD